MRLSLHLDIPTSVLREVLSWYGAAVPEGADRAAVVAAWNRLVATRRAS